MTNGIDSHRYDVIIAGARCAGASTALLLARAGLRVLAVDPTRRGTDTLSTHALMRGAVQQLQRWGLLETIRASGAAPITATSFHYGEEVVEVAIKSRNGVDALYAPRRTVLDRVLADAAEEAGATIVHGLAVGDLIRDTDGRVRGAIISGPGHGETFVRSDLVIGADGVNSRLARILGVAFERTLPSASATMYGYVPDLRRAGYHWHYVPGASVGLIPTNDGDTCVFAAISADRFAAGRSVGLEQLYTEVLGEVDAGLAEGVAASGGPGKLRAFAGRPGFLRPAAGSGWALVGDAAYFRDPITAHGITDALREAEFLARAVLRGEEALRAYGSEQGERVATILELSDRLASFDWELEEARAAHIALAREMKRLAGLASGLEFAGLETALGFVS